MNFLYRHYNRVKNNWTYRIHTQEVTRFVKEMYPSLTVKNILGPLFDNELNIDKAERKELIYLVIFQKDCPENQIHLKVKKSTIEVSEIEKY